MSDGKHIETITNEQLQELICPGAKFEINVNGQRIDVVSMAKELLAFRHKKRADDNYNWKP